MIRLIGCLIICDSLRGLTTLKQLGLAKQYANNIYDVPEEHRKATMSTLKLQFYQHLP